jgi:serine/threonine protein phosphatase PrpC
MFSLFSGSSKYEILTSYIIVLLLLLVFARFLAILVFKLIKNDYKNSTQEVNLFVNDVHYAVSYWTEKGGRPYQEDRHSELKGCTDDKECIIGKRIEDSSLYGVFDGHGGFNASEFCRENLLYYTLQDPDFKTNPNIALRNAFFRINEEFTSMAKLKRLNDGTTAVVAAIHGRRVFVANAGDSRGIIIQKGGKVFVMSIDHKPDREDEELRIKRLGGKVIHWGRWRVEGILAVSRAIGDISLQPYVTCEPEVVEKDITYEDEYLVLASDG